MREANRDKDGDGSAGQWIWRKGRRGGGAAKERAERKLHVRRRGRIRVLYTLCQNILFRHKNKVWSHVGYIPLKKHVGYILEIFNSIKLKRIKKQNYSRLLVISDQ